MTAKARINQEPERSKSQFVRKMRAILKREPLRNFLQVMAVSDDGIILTEDCHLGAILIGPPMSGIDEGVVSRIKGSFSSEMPAGSTVSFSYISSPDIEDLVGAYEAARHMALVNNETPENLQDMVRTRTKLFRDGVKRSPIPGYDCLVNKPSVIVSLKFPIRSAMPTQEEMFEVSERVTQMQEGLHLAGLYMKRLDGKGSVLLFRRLLNMNADTIPTNFNTEQPLRDQIVGAGDFLETEGHRVFLNDNDIRVMSVKMRPEYTDIRAFAHLVGDPNGGPSQFNVPFMLTTSLYFPDRVNEVGRIRSKSAAINYQAFGAMLKWVPLLGLKKEGLDTIINDLDQGGTPVRVSTSLCLFGRVGDESNTNKQIGMVRSHYSFFEYVMEIERRIALPVFLNALPLNASEETIKGLERHDTMCMTHAVHMLPIMGDWQGTGYGGAMMFLSRRNQPMLMDFYDSSTSRNAVVFAESGSGKSFNMQQIVTDYLSTGGGTRAWVIDVGFSYYKLCKYLGGEFIELSDDSGICLNPFSDIMNLDDELDYLKGVVAVMINPEGLPAYEASRLEEAIKACYGRMATSMTITEVAEYLIGQDDPRLRDMGNMLFPFTRTGQYGRWFDGVNNLRLDRNFVVLELAQLKERKHLQKVVLFMLMNRIQHDMYLTGANIKKLFLIDEAWELLKEGDIGSMMEAFYRKIRKEGGSAIIAVQSIRDLYQTSAGKAIAENSPFKIVLGQRPETITAIEKEGYLAMDAYGFQCMRSLKTVHGRFSEMMLVTPMGYGVARLVVDKKAQAIFSSSGEERFEIMRLIREGGDPREVVETFIKTH